MQYADLLESRVTWCIMSQRPNKLTKISKSVEASRETIAENLFFNAIIPLIFNYNFFFIL